MGSSRMRQVVFTGDGGIGVKQFLRRLDLWFVGAGDEFNGETPGSKKRRVVQRVDFFSPYQHCSGYSNFACPRALYSKSRLMVISFEVIYRKFTLCLG